MNPYDDIRKLQQTQITIRFQVHDTVSPLLKEMSWNIERQRRLAVAVNKSHAAHMQRVLSLRGYDPRMN